MNLLTPTLRQATDCQHVLIAKQVRRGATAVEFAIIAPVAFMLILGLVEIGRALMMQHMLNNAARMGARIGTIEGKANSDVIAAVTTALQGQPTNGMTTKVTVAGAVADVSTAQPGDEIVVGVSLPVSSFTWLPFAEFLTGSLTGVCTLQRE
jgi:Flp pilus assembly protein TadG